MSGRGAANALTRTTSILAALFFSTSLALAIMAGSGGGEESIIEELTGEAAPTSSDGTLSAEDLLGTLGGEDEPAADVEDADLSAPAAAQDLDAVLESLGTEETPSEPAEDPQGEDEGEETPE